MEAGHPPCSQRAFISEKNWLLCPSQQCLRMLWLSLPDRFEPLGKKKGLFAKKLVRLGGWPHNRKRVTRLGGLLAELTFCLSCKLFASFCTIGEWPLILPGRILLHINEAPDCEDARNSHFRENNKKKIARTMSPKTTLTNLKKKGKEKLKERGERKAKKSKREN